MLDNRGKELSGSVLSQRKVFKSALIDTPCGVVLTSDVAISVIKKLVEKKENERRAAQETLEAKHVEWEAEGVRIRQERNRFEEM